MKFTSFLESMNNTLSPKSDNEIETNIITERLRQARYSFNTALAASGVSVCIGLVGAGLVLSGKVTEGTVTASGGMAASVSCINFAKDANDRLDKLMKELMDED